MKKRKSTWKKMIGMCGLSGLVLLGLMPLKTLGAETTTTTYATLYEDGTESPVTIGEGMNVIYANGTSLIFQDGKMYEDLAPFGEFDSEIDKHIYTTPYIEGLESSGYDGKSDADLTMTYVETGDTDETVYGDIYLTINNTEIRGIYVNHITDATVCIDNSVVTRQYIENADGDVSYTVKNTSEFGNGIYVMDDSLGEDGGLIKGNLNLTLDNVGSGSGSIQSSGTVLGDTTVSINNSSIYDLEPAHITGSESETADVNVTVSNSSLSSMSIAEKGYYGSPATINGDIQISVKDSTIELGIYQYATNVQNSVTNTVTGTANVYVENSTVRDVIDRGGYSNEDSISENASLSLKDVEIETIVSNSVNIAGTVTFEQLVVNNVVLEKDAILISNQSEHSGSSYILNQISGTGTFKMNLKDTSQYIYFEGNNPIAKDTKITIEPVHLEESGYVSFEKNETLGRAIELRFNGNSNATSYLTHFTCTNYELNEWLCEDHSEIMVLDYCETHNYKPAKSSGNVGLMYHASLYDKEVGCTQDGVKTYYCTICDKIEYETTEKLGHKYEKSKVVKPTTTAKGYTVYQCVRCDHSYKGDYVDKLKSISKATVSLSTTSYTYTGKAKTPSTTVKVDGKTLKKDTDYTVKYSNNTNAGTATVTITGKGSYTGTVKKTFTIKAASLSKAKVTLSTTSYTYNGKAKTPSTTVKLGSTTLKKNTDYTVTYKNNTNIGTATVTIKGKGNYAGTISKSYTIKIKSGTIFTVGSYKYKVTGSSTVAFAGLKSTSTTKVKIADTVKYGGKTFKVTAVAAEALKNKTKVTSVTIGANVTSINKNAFNGCSKLKTITIKSTKLESVGSNAFKGIKSNATIKVPKAKLSSYKKLLKGKGQGSKVKITNY